MSHRPRIAQIEPVGGHGGMHHYDIGLARGLAAAGARVHLYTSSVGDLEAGHPDIEIATPFRGSFGRRPRPLRAASYAMALARTLRAVRREDVDLVHLHAFGATRLERFTLARACATGLPVVVTVHDVHSLGSRGRSAARADYFERPAALIAHNRFSRRAIESIVPDRLVVEVPHGHYLDTYPEPPARQLARSTLGIDPASCLLLFFGQIKPPKGLDLLLAALPAATAARPEIRLLIAGRSWRDRPQDYERLIRELGLEERVELRHGFVPDAAVPTLFAASDLVVLPYRRVYQSGVVLLAMSQGCAVLASDLDPMRELVRDGQTGFLFRRGDSRHLGERLAELAARPETLEATGRAARDWVRRHHDWRSIGERTLAVYRRLLQ